MSYGLRCLDGGGDVYFDTTVQNHYRLIGKLLVTASDYRGIQIPSQYNNEDHLFCLGLKNWSSPNLREKQYVGIFNENGWITCTIQRRHVYDPGIAPVELFVFSKKPDVNTAGGFGLVCYDENMGVTFSTFNTSHCLQINDYKSQSSPFTGVLGEGNAVLISALPYQAWTPGPGVAQIDSCMFRVEGGVVESKFGNIGNYSVAAGYSFRHFSVATVQIPDMPIPRLN